MSHMFTAVDLWFNASHGSVHADIFCMKPQNVSVKQETKSAEEHNKSFNLPLT
jgi:FtsZ-interacting cell division protein YlmF